MSEAINNMPAWVGEGEQGDLKIRIYEGFLVFLGVRGKSLAIVNLLNCSSWFCFSCLILYFFSNIFFMCMYI